jgi:hypothetical protein
MKSAFPACGSSCPFCSLSPGIRLLFRRRCEASAFAAVMIGVILWPAIAAAATIGASVGPGPSTTTTFNLAGTGWVVDDGSFPASFGTQVIAYDPSAGPWDKVLAGGGGGDFAASDTGSGALMLFSVTEFLTIGGTTPWTDWHESILQAGWRWLDDRAGSGEPSFTFSSGAPIPGLGITFTDPTALGGGKIDFTFDPLPVGTHLKITKRLIFEGLDPLLPGETFLGKLDLIEYPTVPEPTAQVLALSAAVLALAATTARRLKRSKIPSQRRQA